MVQETQADLFEIVPALRLPGRLAGRLHRRQQQRDQDADDRNHDQQFHQRKTVSGKTLVKARTITPPLAGNFVPHVSKHLPYLPANCVANCSLLLAGGSLVATDGGLLRKPTAKELRQ